MHDYSHSKIRILEASLRLFATNGYTSTSMSDIANAVGIRKSSLYSHFKNKEALFETILNRIIEQHQEQISLIYKAIQGTSPLEQLRRYFIEYIEYCQNNIEVDFWIRFYYFPPESLAKTLLTKTQQTEAAGRAKLHSIIQQGIQLGEIRKLPAEDILLTYYQLLMGFLMSLNDYKSISPSADMERCLNIFFAGIQNH